MNDIGTFNYNRDIAFFLHYRIFLEKIFIGDFKRPMGDLFGLTRMDPYFSSMASSMRESMDIRK